MTFDDILDGTTVYLDANILVYAMFDSFPRNPELPEKCLRLIARCREEHVFGVISTVTISEVCHAAMVLEAQRLHPDENVTPSYLKQHPDVVKGLTYYNTALDDLVTRNNFDIIQVAETDILRAQGIRGKYGLLTNDSIHAHVVLDYGIPAFATNDSDFEGIEGLQVYRPSDLRPSEV